MKRIQMLITFLSLLLCVGSRPLAQTINRHPDEKQIYGSWTWIDSYGGFYGSHSTPENLHIKETLIIEKNQTESLYENDSLVFRHHFRIYKISFGRDSITLIHITDFDSLLPSHPASHIDSFKIAEQYASDKSIELLHEDTLFISDIGSDGTSSRYARIKQ